MSRRGLLAAGLACIAGAVLLGAVAMTAGTLPSTRPGWSGLGASGAAAVSMDEAQQSVQRFLDRRGDSNLELDELMEFDRNFYALVREKSSGVGAFELLVGKRDAVVTYEPGPDMMWNTKYSVMARGGMMGGIASSRPLPAVTAMPVSPVQAQSAAQGWLDQHLGGAFAGTADAFYGYYTFHFERGGRIAGMLSVNGYTGQVWFHSWHGNFIQVKEFSG